MLTEAWNGTDFKGIARWYGRRFYSKDIQTEPGSGDSLSADMECQFIPHIIQQVVVLEGGSQWTRAGFGGEVTPRVIMPTVVGRHREDAVAGNSRTNTATTTTTQAATAAAADTVGRVYVGDETLSKESHLKIKYPVECGVPTNYDDLQLLWDHVFQEKLKVDMSTTGLLVVEGESMCGRYTREKLTQMAFETYNVPNFYLAPSSSLIVSCSDGKNTGVSVDVTDSLTRVVPVYETYFLPHSVRKCFDLSSRLVTEQLASLLMKKDADISLTRSTYKAFDHMKKTMAYVAQDADREKEEFRESQERSYQLPDGKVVTVASERFECAEALFQPQLAGLEVNGLARHVVDTVSRCMEDIRQDLLGNIVLAGGGSLMPGLAPRLQSEIVKELSCRPELCHTHAQVHALPARDLLAWKGGSRLASGAFFVEVSISSEEYDEFGPTLVHRKCF